MIVLLAEIKNPLGGEYEGKRCMLVFMNLAADFRRGVQVTESATYFSRL